MIDLSPMAAVRVDPVAATRLGAGRRAARRARPGRAATRPGHDRGQRLAHRRRRADPRRRHGLARPPTRARLRQRGVVRGGHRRRASVLRAPDREHPDLFWGLRGGGGNFGIVTEFEFQLHPVGTRALVADFYFGVEDAAPAAEGLARPQRRRAPRAGDLHRRPCSTSPAAPCATVGFVWVGDPDARPRVAAARCARSAARSPSGSTNCPTSSCRRKDDDPRATPAPLLEGPLPACASGRRAIDAFLAPRRRPTAPRPAGAACRPTAARSPTSPTTTTAFSHRDTLFEYVAAAALDRPGRGRGPDRGGPARGAALDPFAGRRLRERVDDEGDAGVRAPTPPTKLARLRALKATTTPTTSSTSTRTSRRDRPPRAPPALPYGMEWRSLASSCAATPCTTLPRKNT